MDPVSLTPICADTFSSWEIICKGKEAFSIWNKADINEVHTEVQKVNDVNFVKL